MSKQSALKEITPIKASAGFIENASPETKPTNDIKLNVLTPPRPFAGLPGFINVYRGILSLEELCQLESRSMPMITPKNSARIIWSSKSIDVLLFGYQFANIVT